MADLQRIPSTPEDDDDSPHGSATDGPLRAQTIDLNCNLHLVSDWSFLEALREKFQNADDAIMDSFDIDLETHRLDWDRNPIDDAIKYIAVIRQLSDARNAPGCQAGYIKYTNGELEFVNFKAVMKMEHLRIASTSKKKNPHRAGMHGEGLKGAAVVALRNGSAFKLEASGYIWKFMVSPPGSDHVKCKLTKSKAQLKPRNPPIYDPSRPRHLLNTASIHEDVSAIVTGVDEPTFNSFTDLCLALRTPQPEKMVHCRTGVILRDPSYQGLTFLKRLKIKGYTYRRQSYHFGWNWKGLHTRRDRKYTSCWTEEALAVNVALDEAFANGDDGLKDEIISLWDLELAPSELALMESDMPHALALGILARLKVRYPGSFFYRKNKYAHDDKNQENIIRRSLTKIPTAIPETLWDALERHRLVRCPRAETIHIFESFTDTTTPATTYATKILHCLLACFDLQHSFGDITIKVVRGDNVGVHGMYSRSKKAFLVDERCLIFSQAHEESPCALSLATDIHTTLDEAPHFSCLHIVELLFRECLASYIEALPEHISEVEQRALLKKVPVMLCQVAVNVRVIAQSGAVTVSWASNEPVVVQETFADSIENIVWLHDSESCARSQVSRLLSAEAQESSECACPRQTVTQGRRTVEFTELDSKRTYSVLIARSRPGSIFSLPSAPISALPVEAAPTPETMPTSDASPASPGERGSVEQQAQHEVEQGAREHTLVASIGGQSVSDTPMIDDNDGGEPVLAEQVAMNGDVFASFNHEQQPPRLAPVQTHQQQAAAVDESMSSEEDDDIDAGHAAPFNNEQPSSRRKPARDRQEQAAAVNDTISMHSDDLAHNIGIPLASITSVRIIDRDEGQRHITNPHLSLGPAGVVGAFQLDVTKLDGQQVRRESTADGRARKRPRN